MENGSIRNKSGELDKLINEFYEEKMQNDSPKKGINALKLKELRKNNSKRKLKNKPNNQKRKFRGKDVRKKIGILALCALLTVAGAQAKKIVKNNHEINEIVEQYDGNINAMKRDIRDLISSEFEKALNEKGLTVEIDGSSDGSSFVSRTISVKDEEGNITEYKKTDDLRSPWSFGNNKSSKLDDIASGYLLIEDAKDAAKVLEKVKKFSEEKDLKVIKVFSGGSEKAEVKDVKARETEDQKIKTEDFER